MKCSVVIVFFFKQKTAYEMRISDWSSDVCSSDLALADRGWTSREYVPAGELIPGMAYLVRRILENSSQAGFLTMGRGGEASVESLAPPPVVSDPPHVAPDDAPFERAPTARRLSREFREAFGYEQATSEEHTSEPKSTVHTSYAVHC